MPSFSTLAEWLRWQETLHPRKIDLGLERVASVADRMGNGQFGATVITVAGTNGKGSCVAMLESMLLAAGYRVGSYTSPHLLRYNERIRLHGEEIDDPALCVAFQAVDVARAGETLSYFEFGTLAALEIMNHAGLDIVLLEVGLGGRLDAVNIIDADIALVTAIGIDHVRWLGDDRESIGREKAGIFRAGRPAICCDPAPPASVAGQADRTGADWYALNTHFSHQGGTTSWQWCGPDRDYDRLPLPALPGAHQLDNAAGVLMAVEVLQPHFPVSRNAIDTGLRQVSLPGRCQIIPGAVETVMDVSHNPHGAKQLARTLRERPCAGRTHLVLGMLDDKDAAGFAAAILTAADRCYLAGLNAERGMSAEQLFRQLRDILAGTEVHCCTDVITACNLARQGASPGDRIVVCGSFYTVAAAMELNV